MSMRKSAISLATAFVFLLGACSGSAQEYEIGTNSRGLVYSGAITDLGVSEVIPRLNRSTSLILSSSRGDFSAGSRLAREINRENVSVLITADCFEACSSAVLLLSENVRVLEGATILFDINSVANNNSPEAKILRNCLGRNSTGTTPNQKFD
jgi:hypothetical protein